MKSLFLSVVLALVSSVAFSQANAAYFKNEKGALVAQDQGAVASFDLHMTMDEIAMVKQSFGLYDHIQFSTTKVAEGIYACKLNVSDTNDEHYFVKLLASIGIDHAFIGERSVPIQDLATELARLKM
ncbi:MAG: hypothetical protein RLZZ77_781 [Bacteroidota bacterium]|jgi:ABC-type polar amino acid transport system ATPase subunit